VTLSKKLFYLLIFLLPLNLGKHFVLKDSFVNGLLIDYLIPTIYVQDIVIVLLLCIFIYESIIKRKEPTLTFISRFFSPKLYLFHFFVFSVFLSSTLSLIPFVSLFSFLRLFLYYLLFLYITTSVDFKREFILVLNTLLVSVTLVSILGIFQFIHKGSIFNNYLLFGEQPYSFSTPGIVLENLFGFTVVPSYGLFRHPNIFGGILSILLIFVFSRLKISKIYYFILGVLLVSLLTTFSYLAILSFIIGVFIYLFLQTKFGRDFFSKKVSRNIFGLLLIGLPLFIYLLPFDSFGSTVTSNMFSYFGLSSNTITRRIGLLKSSFQIFGDNFMYGVGISTFTYHIDLYYTDEGSIRFSQPVHNVFALVFSETGFIAAHLFLLIVLPSFTRSFRNPLLLVIFFQIIFLSSFDHYFWTIHQAQLLFWIILGLCWTIEEEY